MASRNPARAGDQLLLTPAGYRLTGAGGTDAIKRLGGVAGVSNAIPHRFRHLFATQYLVAHPGDEMGLRRIMGHLSNEALASYIHLSQLDLSRRMAAVALSAEWLKAR